MPSFCHPSRIWLTLSTKLLLGPSIRDLAGQFPLCRGPRWASRLANPSLTHGHDTRLVDVSAVEVISDG
jgi:hypothetical protein